MCGFNTMKTAPYLFSVVFIVENILKTHAYREFEVNGDRTILSLENETVNIQCLTDMPMAYCGFMHPNGKRYSISGASLIDGHCSIKINATKADSGEWKCHIGTSLVGVESEQRIRLRVVDKLAAVVANVTVARGDPATLFCASAQTLVPLSYCRFEPPSGPPFSISSEVNIKNAILDKYYFPANKSLERGDCAVTIRKVRPQDVGAWGCGAGLNDGKEYLDVIFLQVYGSTTGIIAGSVGAVVALGVLAAAACWHRRWLAGAGRQGHTPQNLELAAPVTPAPAPTRLIPVLVVESPTDSTLSSSP